MSRPGLLIYLIESHRFCNRVQDAYTLRCCPQVHGIVHDTIHFVKGIITTEMNSATDNPVSFYMPRPQAARDIQ